MLKDVGVLVKVWPRERVIMGLRVCRWMNQELLHNVGKVLIRAMRGNIQTKDVCDTLVRLRRIEVALMNANASTPALSFKILEGMSSAASSFGRRLVQIDFTSNHFGDLGADILIDLIEQFESLQCLELGNNDISNKCLALVSALANNCKAITHLDLHENMLGDQGISVIASGLKEWKSLVHLDLCGTQIQDRGATLLAENLVQLTALTHLAIAHNNFGPAGDEMLAGALPQCTQLRCLNLAANLNMSSRLSGHRGTLEALSRCSALTHLDLSRCELDDWALHQLVAVLMNCTALTYFDLSDNALCSSVDRARMLAAGVACAAALTTLDLQGNPLMVDAAGCFEEVSPLKRTTGCNYIFTVPLVGAQDHK